MPLGVHDGGDGPHRTAPQHDLGGVVGADEEVDDLGDVVGLAPPEGHVVPLRFPAALEVEEAEAQPVFDTELLQEGPFDATAGLGVAVEDAGTVEFVAAGPDFTVGFADREVN